MVYPHYRSNKSEVNPHPRAKLIPHGAEVIPHLFVIKRL